MTASELMNELISNHADGQRSHVNWRFSDDSKLDVRLLKMKVASKRELASKQASGLSSLNHLEKVNMITKTMS